MEKTEIKFNFENNLRINKKYILFRRIQEFKKIPSYLIFGVSLLLTILGITLAIDIFLYMGIIIFLSISIVLLYYYILFKIAFSKYKNAIIHRTKDNKNEFDFIFSFNSEEIIQEYSNITIKVKWEFINKYQENKNDFYLYYEQNKLFIIFSEIEFGNKIYEEFKKLLKEKVKKQQ